MTTSLQKLSDEDQVILCLNDHWVVLLPHMLAALFFSVITGLLLFFGFWMHASNPFLSTVSFLVGFLLFLFIAHYLSIVFLNWELSSWVVTMQRVIDFQNTPYIENDVTFVNIREIHEIEKKKHGFWANVFDYGEIHINLAATPEPIIFRHIPHPGKFANLIESIRNKSLHKEIDLKSLQQMYGRRYRFVIKSS